MSSSDAATLAALIDYLKQQGVLPPSWPDLPVDGFNTDDE